MEPYHPGRELWTNKLILRRVLKFVQEGSFAGEIAIQSVMKASQGAFIESVGLVYETGHVALRPSGLENSSGIFKALHDHLQDCGTPLVSLEKLRHHWKASIS